MEYPAPATPTELEEHECIDYRLLDGGGLLPWQVGRDGRRCAFGRLGVSSWNNGDLAFAAIRSGAGLGFMLEGHVADDLAGRRLV